MNDIPAQPAFHRPPAIVEHGPVRSLTSSQASPPKSVPRETLKIISELGLRYEPSGQAADLQSHAARVALLAQDCADLNPSMLRSAATRWARAKPFLPKASELHAIIEDMASAKWRDEQTGESLRASCDERNAWAKRIGLDWWWRVITIDRGGEPVRATEKLEGLRAVEERNRAEGRRTEWYKPTPADLASIHDYIAKAADNDLSQQEFASMVRRTGGAPRR